MTDEPVTNVEAEDFGVAMPPNARIGMLLFQTTDRTMHVALADGGEERIVSTEAVRSFFGARIRHVSVSRVPPKGQGPALTETSLRASGGLPQSALNPSQRTGTEVVREDLNYAVAIRVEKLPELWYLNASSFNFRKALGENATYSTEINLRALVRRLSQFAPDAVRDGFFTAVLQNSPLPPPLESLLEFFRLVSR